MTYSVLKVPLNPNQPTNQPPKPAKAGFGWIYIAKFCQNWAVFDNFY